MNGMVFVNNQKLYLFGSTLRINEYNDHINFQCQNLPQAIA